MEVRILHSYFWRRRNYHKAQPGLLFYAFLYSHQFFAKLSCRYHVTLNMKFLWDKHHDLHNSHKFLWYPKYEQEETHTFLA